MVEPQCGHVLSLYDMFSSVCTRLQLEHSKVNLSSSSSGSTILDSVCCWLANDFPMAAINSGFWAMAENPLSSLKQEKHSDFQFWEFLPNLPAILTLPWPTEEEGYQPYHTDQHQPPQPQHHPHHGHAGDVCFFCILHLVCKRCYNQTRNVKIISISKTIYII